MVNPFSFDSIPIEGLIITNYFVATDNRGFYAKSYSEKIFKELGFNVIIKEISHITSHKGVVRGLHFQRENPQAKMFRCVCGRIFAVAVDLRKGSETIGKWFGVELSPENRKGFLVPKGFAAGNISLEENSVLVYESTENYYPEFDMGIAWDDPDVGIEWPLGQISSVILSDKDKNSMSYREFIQQYGGV